MSYCGSSDLRSRAAFNSRSRPRKNVLRDGLSVEDVLESIVNANAIKKVLRSRSKSRTLAREYLYVIESPNFSGMWVYTKGTIRHHDDREIFYVLVSSKLSD